MSIGALNRELKFFDGKLFAVKAMDASVDIYRKHYCFEKFSFSGHTLLYSRPDPYRVLSLTDDWSPTGNPVEWGIEPVLGRLREIDNHNHNVLARIYEENEMRERMRKRSNSNEIKARAYDLRRDFAKALNDVNTSTLEKVESRRTKDAYCSKRP